MRISELAVLSWFICACGEDAAPKPPLEIGLLLPLSGDLGTFGKAYVDGINLAINEINTAGGVLGRPLRSHVIDDGTTPEGSTDGYATLTQRGVPVIIGPAYSSGVAAVADQIKATGTLTLGVSTTSPALTTLDDGGAFFRTVPSDAVQGIVLAAEIVAARLGAICIVFRDETYGRPLAELTAQRIGAASTRVTLAPFDPTATNLSQVLAPCDPLVASSSAGILFITFVPDGALLVQDAARRGWTRAKHKVFLSDGIRNMELLPMLSSTDLLEGAVGTAPAGPDPASAAGARFRDFQNRYQMRFGGPPPTYTENSYDAIYLAAAAIQAAGTATDRTAIARAVSRLTQGTTAPVGDWAAVKKAIEGGGANLDGVTGSLDFDAAGDPLPPYYITIWTVAGGALQTQRVVTVTSL